MNDSSANLDAYPKTPFDEIALAISGGGFRAATYGLGTLMYLRRLKFDGKSLLERTQFMSSASGGSIAVVFYLLSLHKNEDFDTFKARLLGFMKGERLLHDAERILADDTQWDNTLKTQNLINAFAKVYDNALEKMRWESLWEISKRTHLKEVCINATEFQSGLSFRFQNSASSLHNVIGNNLVKLSRNDAVKNLRMGDLLAASSCFPLGFEPMIFPQDFASDTATNQQLMESITFVEANKEAKKGSPFALMDGGITDNQGVESMMLAYDRRFEKQKKDLDQGRISKVKPFDLMIVADVSNRIIPPYKQPKIHFEENNSIEHYVRLVNSSLQVAIWAGLITTAASGWGLLRNSPFGLLFIVPSVVILFGSLWLYEQKNRLLQWFDRKISAIEVVPTPTLKKFLAYFGGLKITTLSNLLITRLDSVSTMTGEVFLKRIRRLIFEQFYSDKRYDFRRVSSFIYALSKGYQKTPEQEEEQDKTKESKKYPPSSDMMEIAEQARTFGTTLWFDTKANDSQITLKLMATAQFTLCHSLLNYFVELEKERDFKTLASKDELLKLKKQLLEDWESFSIKPLQIKE
ncbi:MAG: patatin-like phospholipase family protein [Spirosomaceae bacterium]|nr:patatin-like phospholipase family protein [Spirosomataceae bacterium]